MSSSPPPIPPPRYVFVAYGWKWIIRSPVRVIRLVRYNTYVFHPPRGRNTGRGLMASFPSWRRRQKKPHPKKNDFSHLLFCNTMPLGGASPPLTKRLCKNFTANFCQFPSPWLPILFLQPPSLCPRRHFPKIERRGRRPLQNCPRKENSNKKGGGRRSERNTLSHLPPVTGEKSATQIILFPSRKWSKCL